MNEKTNLLADYYQCANIFYINQNSEIMVLFSIIYSLPKMAEDNSCEEKQLQFHQMELDDRVLKAIALLGWLTPTLIQEKAIPLLLEGKDVLVRAKTGSGKNYLQGVYV